MLYISQLLDVSNKELEMRKYFAWVLFTLGAVNVIAKGSEFASGKMPLLFDWPAGTVNTLFFLGFISLCFYLWNRWK